MLNRDQILLRDMWLFEITRVDCRIQKAERVGSKFEQMTLPVTVQMTLLIHKFG